MVHYGKHIIDPKTGLCEICDRGTIHDLRRGKRTGKQFLYSNQDGRFTYRPNDDDDGRDYHHPHQQQQQQEPTPRTNPKRSTRREYTPPPEYDDSPRHPARPKVYYEVDDEGQMYPRSRGPPDEPRRRYMTQTRPQPAPTRRVQTPPPQPAPTARPKRQVNSDTEVLERRYRSRPHDETPELYRRPELYHIDAHQGRYQPIHRIEEAPAPARRRPQQLEPIERKVYRKAPPKDSPPSDLYAQDGHHLRLTRKVETIYPTPRQHYGSSPTLNQTFDRGSRAQKQTTLYHLQPVNAY